MAIGRAGAFAPTLLGHAGHGGAALAVGAVTPRLFHETGLCPGNGMNERHDLDEQNEEQLQ